MNKTVLWLLTLVFILSATFSDAQLQKAHRVGIIFPGGAWHETIDGLRVELRQLALEPGKQFNLVIRETKGDAKAAEKAARNLEEEKIDLIYTAVTSVTLAAKRATSDTSIVFAAGADPVVLGLVDSFSHPGDRLTGVFYRDSDLTGQRLELLKEIVPKLRRIVTFYNPSSPDSPESAKLVRQTAGPMGVKFAEQHVSSVEELQASLRVIGAGDVDAIFEVSDALVQIHDQRIIDTAGVKSRNSRLCSLTAVPSSRVSWRPTA